MPKRFTDTDKWKKKFIRGLQAPYKLLWLYILDECDHAGVWIVDFDVAKLRLDEIVEEDEALKCFSEKILPIDSGEKWLILDFIEFQYGELNEGNNAHKGVIKILRKHDLWHEEEKTIIKNKPLISPSRGAKEKDKDKDKEQEKDKDKEEAEIFEIFYPFNSPDFLNAWRTWMDYRKEIKKPYKSKKSEQAALKQLSEFDETFSIKLIERSIAGGYQGLVFDDTKANYLKAHGQATKNAKPNSDRIDQAIDAMLGARKQG
jgi:hypothetical protein